MNDPTRELIVLVEEAPEGGFVARALGHSIFTEADTLDELRKAVRDAVRCHFDDTHRPKAIRLHIVREAELRCDGPFGCLDECASEVDTLGYSLPGRSDKPPGV